MTVQKVNVKIPTEADLGTTADLHDVVGFIEHATIGLRHAGFEPTWYADVSDVVSYYAIDEIPPRIGPRRTAFTPDAILEIVMYFGGWVDAGHASRERHVIEEMPPLCL